MLAFQLSIPEIFSEALASPAYMVATPMTTKAIGLISSLFNVTLSRDVPFYQPLQLQCSYYGSTELALFSFVLHSFLHYRVGDLR